MKKVLLLFLIFGSTGWGQTTFQKTYGDTGHEQMGSFIKTTDGGYIMVGNTDAGNSYDVYVVKTDSDGVVQWTKIYGGAGIDGASSIAPTQDGGYIITGYSSISNPSNINLALLLKLDMSGTLQWTKTYGLTYEGGQSVVQTSDKGYLVTGSTGSYSSSMHLYVFKTDSAGVLQWTKKINGGGCCGYGGSGSAVIETANKTYMLLGNEYYYPATRSVIYLAKFGLSSSIKWEAYFSFTASSNTAGLSLEQTADKGFIITGGINGGAILFKVDSNGVNQWANEYSWLNNAGLSVIQTKDGGFAFTGYGSSKNISVIKTSSSGSLQWAKAYGDTTAYKASALTIFQNADKGFTIGGHTSSNSGSNDLYLIKTDSLGKSNCNEFTINPIVTSLSVLGFGGFTPDSLGIDSLITFQENSITGVETIFCHQTDQINEIGRKNSVSLFPNPFSSQTVIKTNNYISNGVLYVYNPQGQIVKQAMNIYGDEIIFRRDNLPEGLYFFRLMQDSKIVVEGKLIITGN